MPVRAAHLLTIVEAKTEEHDRKLKAAGKEVEKLAKKDKELASASADAAKEIRGMGAALTAAFSAAALAGAKKMFDAASNLNETVTKSRVVFGDSARAIEQWASTSARAMGQSRQQAMEAAATYGNLFTSMGITREAAAKMSTQITQLASDLASFNNVPVAQALEAIRSGLVGETEPLRQFGVNLNEATLKAEALRLGLIKSTKEGLEPSTKAAAAYSIILKQTKNAQGDFAETASGAANQQRIFTAQLQDTAAKLGQVLLPVGNQALKWLNDMLTTFNQMPAATQNFAFSVAGLAAAAGPLAMLIGKIYELRKAFIAAGMLTAGGKAGIIGAVFAAAFSPHAMAAFETFNLNNQARENNANLPDHMKKEINARQLGDEIAELRRYQGLRREDRYENITRDSVLGRGMIHAFGESHLPRARLFSAERIEKGIQKLRQERERLRAEGVKLQATWKKTERENGRPAAGGDPFSGFDWLGGIPTQTTDVDDSALKKRQAAWQRHLEAIAALRQRMADRMAQITHNQFERERRELNQFMAELRKAGISQAERRRFFGAVSADITGRESDFIREGVADASAAMSTATSGFGDHFTRIWNQRKEAMKEASRAASALGASLSGLGFATGGISGVAQQSRVNAGMARFNGAMAGMPSLGDFLSPGDFKRPPGPMDAASNQFTREARAAGRQLLLGLVGRRGENRDLFRQFAGQIRDSLAGVFYDHAKDIWKPLTDGFRDRLKDAIAGSVKVAEAGVYKMLAAVYALLNALGSGSKQRRTGGLAGAFVGGLIGFMTGGPAGAFIGASTGASFGAAAAEGDLGGAIVQGGMTYIGARGGPNSVFGPVKSGGGRAVQVAVNYNGPISVNERADVDRVARETVRRSVAAVRSGALG